MVKDELKNAGATRELLRELEVLNEKGFPVNPMECVAKGASLKAARIAKPNVQSEPYAYGTKFWPIPGTDDYFCTIIPSNSNYPIKCSTTIKHYNPTTKRVPIPLIKRLSYDEQGKTLYRYYHLGDYDCYIKSTGEKPLVDITMELTADKILVTTFTHKQTNESLVLERLDELKGKEIILQEHTWKIEHEDDDGDDNDNGDKRIQIDEWTREQLDRAIHVARMLIEDYAAQSQNNKVIKKRAELESLIQNVKQPNDARFIMNRMYELLNLLKNSRDINEDDYHFYRQELRKIV
jgi:molecular chaperone DnaK (HSP70)